MKKLILFLLVGFSFCTSAMGAELLVLNQSCVDPSCMKAEDVASIHPDGTDWANVCKKCVPPLWRIVKLPGVPEKDLQYLTEQLTEQVEIVDPVVFTKAGEVPQEIGRLVVKQPEYRSEIIRERKYSLPTTLKTATYDAKGMYTVPTKSIATVKTSFVAKSLTTEKTAVLVEKEALSAEISR